MLPHYQHILVPMDLSPNSIQAFKHAIMLARHNDSRLHLLHVIPEVDAAMRSYIEAMLVKGSLDRFEHGHEDKARETLQDELKSFAARELADHPEDLNRIDTFEVLHGNPITQILQTAERVDADVVVMGAHSKGQLEYAFLGRTAEKVLRKSVRPVLVIPFS
ncbi:MAG: universal stress protein [Desulfuromonadaceae bacterium]|nr:universal stress protein [Desulfuromonadaceae bacterium]